MDIEAIVAKVTQQVMTELGGGQPVAKSPAQDVVDRMPPAVRPQGVSYAKDNQVIADVQQMTGNKKVCLQYVTGECGGRGCCSELVPGSVDKIIQSGACRIGNALGGEVPGKDIAGLIDHTLLKPDVTEDQIVSLCQEARENGFCSVCVNPGFVALASQLLRGSQVKVCTVVGFPLGATTTLTKVTETRDAIANGADEIDMVINIGALKNHQDALVEADIREVVQAAGGRIVKTIFETALLTDEEVVRASLLAKSAGADFVKTSTGFGPGGATVHHVRLMRESVGPVMGVKASGGVRDLETVNAMVEAGATRIGASASVKIVRGEQGSGSY